MKPNMTREMLEQELIQPTLKLKRRRKVTDSIKKHLFSEHALLEGNVQSLIADPRNELPKVDNRILFLFAEQIYKQTLEDKVNPDHYYNEHEVKLARKYSGNIIKKDEVRLPLTLNNFIEVNFNEYVGKITIEDLAKLSSSLLNYNFDIQREAVKVKRGNNIELEAKLVQKNVREIKNNLKAGTQKTTQIVINASAGTSDDGEELLYNPETLQLTINEGTILDIVDGYHRSKAAELAHNEDPSITREFTVLMLNCTDDEAKKYQGQLAEATPISRTRQKQLSSKRMADEVVRNIMAQSDLKGHVSSDVVNLSNAEYVTYEMLAQNIENYFDIKLNMDVRKVSAYLKDYFDMLVGSYPDAFLNNPSEVRKTSVINENTMFAGYVKLASRMYKDSIDVMKVIDYMEKIDFSRLNPLWKEIGYLQEDGKLGNTDRAKKQIVEYFNNLEL